MHDMCHYLADILIAWEMPSRTNQRSSYKTDLVCHRFRSRCQQMDNLCFASMFNIDFDQVLINECFYRCVTLEIQIC